MRESEFPLSRYGVLVAHLTPVPALFEAFSDHMAEHDVTIEHVAKLLGRPPATVERACREEITPELFVAVAQLTDIDPADLMTEIMRRAGTPYRPLLPLHYGAMIAVNSPRPPRRPRRRGRADHDRHGRPTT